MISNIDKTSRGDLIEAIFGIHDSQSFEDLSLAVFRYQYQKCEVYNRFCDILQRNPGNVKNTADIPFMPVDFFRDHHISCLESKQADLIFESSTTTGAKPARHFIADAFIYEESIKRCFNSFYGNPSEYCIIALLPGYFERGNSSLVYMVNKLMEWSAHPMNGFYLHDFDKLNGILERLERKGDKVLLIGVSHALLDFSEKYRPNLKNTIVMETGGMKGQRKELVRPALHEALKSAFNVGEINSEYSMTELLSQAYSFGKGLFKAPSWMRVVLREMHDPFSDVFPGRTGVINIIDLANVYSCSFIATHDLGKQGPGSAFEVLGRMDNSEMRGCNLMVA